ncbi:MAG: hypothetical protein H6Q01_1043, partial [Acidobacteria bacterium]|nr:hypothetical protein [Acidobacteriota bacterium]
MTGVPHADLARREVVLLDAGGT